jgi:hypothetical protein
MKFTTYRSIPLIVALLLAGCADSLLDGQSGPDPAESIAANVDGKLRHSQLTGRSSAGVAGKLGVDSEVFVGFNEYEADGITRRVLDSYGITRRVLEEYGVTRRVMDSYGVTRRVLEEYGVTRRVLESYGITRRVLDSYGITGGILDQYNYVVTEAFLAEFGLTFEQLEAQGVTRRVLEEYGVTRRVLSEYQISDQQWDEAVAAFERSLRLKVRIDGAVPGVFLSLGSLPLATFLEEVADDADITFVEMDVTLSGPPVGTIQQTDAGNELLPWGVNHIGAPSNAPSGLENVHVYVLDSGVRESADLNVVERKDFTMLFTNRTQTTWDDSEILEMPYFDPGSTGNPEDETGHGTHIAGSIGAMANGNGVIGTAPGVAIHSLKVMTAEGQTDVTTVLSALDYVIVQKLQAPATPMVVNLSLGMDIESAAYNVLDEGVRRATEYGVHVVVSAGNAASDSRTFSPAHVAEAITVGAYSPNGSFSNFSNFGASVDLLAPGDLIASLSNDAQDEAANLAVIESGTSMAAGHATGAVALLLATNPQALPGYVRSYLMSSARSTLTSIPQGTANRALTVGHSVLQDATLPPFLQFAIAANNDIEVSKGGVKAPANGTNASIYAGDDLVGLSGLVEGFGYYADRNASKTTYAPVFNPSGLSPTLQVAPLEIPSFNIADLSSRAVNASSGVEYRETAGNLIMEGEMILGTAEVPVVWRVRGELVNMAGVTISGFGTFLVEGEVKLNHSVSTNAGSAVAFISDAAIWAAKGTSISGHLFSTLKTNVEGDLRGSVISQSIAVVWGGTLEYAPIPCVLTEVFWPTGLCSAQGLDNIPAGEPTTTPESTDTPVSEGPAPTADEPVSDQPVSDEPVSEEPSATASSLQLTTEAATVKGKHRVKLQWEGASSGRVDIYRNGALVNTTDNTGAWNDNTGQRRAATYVHKVCEAGTDVCSAEVTTTY